MRGKGKQDWYGKSKEKKIMISIIASILIICIAVGGYIYKVFVIDAKHIERVFTKKSQVSKNSSLKYPFDYNSVNILIVGLDKASNRTVYDMHRTDTILFININFKDKKLKEFLFQEIHLHKYTKLKNGIRLIVHLVMEEEKKRRFYIYNGNCE